MNHSVCKRIIALLCSLVLCCGLLAGCGGDSKKAPIPDGIYTADFSANGSMFHVNETCDGKGTLTVKDGQMTIHITMPSKNIVNLFAGLAEDAKKEGAALIEPTLDSVTYPDGITEEVYGFDLPVPYLDQEFPVAIIGTHGNWYDHNAVVSHPEPMENAG